MSVHENRSYASKEDREPCAGRVTFRADSDALAEADSSEYFRDETCIQCTGEIQRSRITEWGRIYRETDAQCSFSAVVQNGKTIQESLS